MDKRNAVIFLCDEDIRSIMKIRSEVEEFNPVGGYGGARKDMPQDAFSDKKLLERELLQKQKYFNDILDKLPGLQELYVFGPGDTRKHFVNAASSDHKFRDTEIVEETADQMTENQMRARVRAYFNLDGSDALKNVKPPKQTTIPVEHEFVNVAVSDPIEIMVNERLEKLRKKFPMLIRAKAYYKKEKDPDNKNMLCEMELSVPGQNLFAQSRSNEMVKAVAEVIDDLRRQLKRKKGRMSP